MIETIESIIYVLIVLGGLIFFHELGHFLMGRAFGMGVSTFSLGFGPKLLKYTHGKTEYCLSLIPLGGYCALVGEEVDAELPEGFTAKESFALRPAWQRLLVVIAGPFANVLLAWLLCWGLAYGYGQQYILPVVGSVMENSAAAEAGLQAKDRIVSINHKAIDNWTTMADAIEQSKGKAMDMRIEREGKPIDITLTAKTMRRKNIFGEEVESYAIGIHAANEVHHSPVGFIESAKVGAIRTWDMVVFTWTGFVKLFQRVVPLDQVGGPIMIAQMVGQQAEQGLAPVLALAALISINLGILNLLPIPVLDGGHIVFYTFEIITRRPVSPRIRNILTQVGFFILIGLMLLATFNDIWRLVKGFWD